MHGIITARTVLVSPRKVKWGKLSVIDNFVSFNALIILDMLTVNQEFLARDSTIQGKSYYYLFKVKTLVSNQQQGI